MMKRKLLTILLVEDNESDIMSFKRAMEMKNLSNPVHVVRDGEECLDYLHRRGKHSDPVSSPLPDIVILDVNMPRMGGFKVLKHLRDSDRFRRIPIIILTTSSHEADVIRAYELYANAYVVKPTGLNNLSNTLKDIVLFWERAAIPELEP